MLLPILVALFFWFTIYVLSIGPAYFFWYESIHLNRGSFFARFYYPLMYWAYKSKFVGDWVSSYIWLWV